MLRTSIPALRNSFPSRARVPGAFRPLSPAACLSIRNMSASISTATGSPLENQQRPIVLSGPSGVGKSTLLKKLFAEFPNTFGFSVSHTTRAPRPGEIPGQSYHYVTREEFEALIAQGAFLEYAQFGGNYYGTTAQAVKDVSIVGEGKTTEARQAVLDIDAQGVQIIKERHPSLHPRFIFISPPSFSSLRTRLEGRGTETPESIQRRLAMAASELAYARTGAHDFIIVNDDLERAYGKLKAAILGTLKQGEGDVMPPAEKDEEEAVAALQSAQSA